MNADLIQAKSHEFNRFCACVNCAAVREKAKVLAYTDRISKVITKLLKPMNLHLWAETTLYRG